MGNRPPQAWPVLSDAALVGLAGDIVRTLLPHTEADQAALLVTFLTMFGSCVGPGPYMMVGSVRHEARLFTVICGATARARKEQSFHDIRQFFKLADSLWLQRASISGLSSGEGVIEAMKAAGDIGTFIIEEEFARALTAVVLPAPDTERMACQPYLEGRHAPNLSPLLA